MALPDESLLADAQAVSIGAARHIGHGIIVARPPSGEGEGPLRSYYADIQRSVAETTAGWCVITDGSHVSNLPGASERRLHGELTNSMPEDDQGRCAGSVIVMPNTFIRHVVTGILWLMKNQVESRTVPDMVSALREAREMIARG